MSIKIDCIEYYLPENILTNEALQVENPSWRIENLSQKTGIFKRHIAAESETAFDLSKKASDKIFCNHPINKEKIDGIILIKFNAEGYGFIYLLKALLGRTPGHTIHCNSKIDWEYFLSETMVNEEEEVVDYEEND